MKHAITVRLNDRYEAEKILFDRIDAIHEKTHHSLLSQAVRRNCLTRMRPASLKKLLQSFWKSCGKSFRHIFSDMPPALLPPGRLQARKTIRLSLLPESLF